MNAIQLPDASPDAAIAPLKLRAVRPKRAHRMLDMGRTKFFNLMARGEIATIKIDGVRLIEVDEIDRFLARKRAEAVAESAAATNVRRSGDE